MKKRRSSYPKRCRDCSAPREPDDRFFGGRCEACRIKHSSQLRRQRGAKQLQDVQETKTEVRAGQEFTVVTLAPRGRAVRPKR